MSTDALAGSVPPPPSEKLGPSATALLAVLCAAFFLDALDISMIGVARGKARAARSPGTVQRSPRPLAAGSAGCTRLEAIQFSPTSSPNQATFTVSGRPCGVPPGPSFLRARHVGDLLEAARTSGHVEVDRLSGVVGAMERSRKRLGIAP